VLKGFLYIIANTKITGPILEEITWNICLRFINGTKFFSSGSQEKDNIITL